MCGRLLVRTPTQETARIFRTAGVPPASKPRFNLAPTAGVLCVRFNPADGLRHLGLLHWGLIPLWAKERAIGNKLINARSETITEKPAFKEAFEQRRCLIPADGFYEWQKTPDSKQPFAILPAEGSEPPLFAFAGLWERWRDPVSREIVRSCTIVTGPANDLMQPIHARMPIILDACHWAKWLGEAPASRAELRTMLVTPFPSARMRAYAIGTRVNSAAFDHETILQPA
jgi:putative SOS response-associated peptidase YedK